MTPATQAVLEYLKAHPQRAPLRELLYALPSYPKHAVSNALAGLTKTGQVIRTLVVKGKGQPKAHWAWNSSATPKPEVYMIDLLKVRLWGQGDMRPFP